ncbi:methylenetetrahydrofolate reductase (NAD(P)H) met13 [Spiromyces aspiralis]|uniref:Methylenetetrahydrofolate reductase (NAD(P)H) met13 n=1 Tax=Spiromyces aspiralis TaxID=68401 RepID=A0ACC1HJV1_9FUNG|nr:methylenetetrahydrofolate reductase (NAD(P)H) met13 [Spiromyces aspiralis]
MKIIDKILKREEEGAPYWSFEYFPPKTQQGLVNLYDRIGRMYNLGPLFIDVTWRWGGKSSDLTLEICSMGQSVYGLETNMHMTCTNTSFDLIKNALAEAKENGIQNILALRGDLPRGVNEEDATDAQFRYAVDLVKYTRREYGDFFCISVAGYPEGCASPDDVEKDILYLKEKVDAGADLVITQLFYDVDLYLDWVARCRKAGISVPILPGIMPIQNYNGFKRMTELCKIRVPQEVWDSLEDIKEDDQAVKNYGIELAVKMIRELRDSGVNGFHFYTLNLERSTQMILEKMNFIPKVDEIRPLPWAQPISDKRARENVRPIFWRNQTRNYIARTANWDEFPNGRWGDSRSPAYGELVHGVQIRFSTENALKIWGEPASLKDVQDLFISYCRGQLSSLPWSDTPLLPESDSIRDQLAQLNAAGYLTINSQPSANSVPSKDPVHGWGPPNGFVYKKAYLEFFISPELLEHVLARIRNHPTITYLVVNKKGELQSNFDTESPNAVTWGVFPGKEIIQPTIVESISFLAWKDEAFDFWSAWSKVYQPDSPSHKLLNDLGEKWYLMNIVENNYLEPDSKLHDLLLDISKSAGFRKPTAELNGFS